MGWSESVQGCKKHPTPSRSPGVCSSCLRERLSQLSDSANNSKRKTTTIRLGTAYNNVDDNYYSDDDDGGASPARRHHRHHRNASEALAFLFNVGGGGGGGGFGGGLKKSRTIAVVPRSFSHRFGSEVVKKNGSVNNIEKKKGGFWSKLINGATGKRKNDEAVKHSKTLRESFRL